MDYSLYSKFWQIQDFFRYITERFFLHLTFVCSRNPAQCYQKVPWKQFSMYAADVLSTFQVNTTLNTSYEIETKLKIAKIGRASNWTQQVGRVPWWEIKRLNIILPSKLLDFLTHLHSTYWISSKVSYFYTLYFCQVPHQHESPSAPAQ